jgi:preprotein translocase subunit SecA
VLVFFENKTKLENFRDSTNIKNKMKHYPLTEDIPKNEEKEKMVGQATHAKSVTFATPGFGRGTDFICRDPEVEYNGGIHVILTFMCRQQSEFVQI